MAATSAAGMVAATAKLRAAASIGCMNASA
jgi:hypothetical protein